ncbi:MAG: cupin domain-containing protein [Pseudoflavonifractor sp.]|nr:cupin domain-containing protein [Alloprevotella sp.]MCM1116732.1 cupin domain-containing protein [Pseudoflavonifractor sp.]
MTKTDVTFGEVFNIKDLIGRSAEKIQFAGVVSNEHGGVSLLSFTAGQALPEHLAPAEVMVYVIEGQIEFTMRDNLHTLLAGQFLLMGAGVAHSVVARADSLVMLIKIKP